MHTVIAFDLYIKMPSASILIYTAEPRRVGVGIRKPFHTQLLS